MQELSITQKGLEDLQVSHAGVVYVSRSTWARQMLPWRPSAPALSGPGMRHQKLATCSHFLTWPRQRYPSWRRLSVAV
jgi:hypothetical protein